MGATHSSTRAAHGGTNTYPIPHSRTTKGRRSFSKDSSHRQHYPQYSSSGQLHYPSPSPTPTKNTLHPPASPSSYPYYGHPQYNNHTHYSQSHNQSQTQNHHLPYSPPSSNTSHSSSLQRAFGRRRSSNQTVESLPSSLGSATYGSTPNSSILHPDHHNSPYRPRHSEAEEAGHNNINGHGQHDDHEFRRLHGRRYHNTSSLYMLPNDTEEVDRLHLQHYIFKMIMGDKNIHVPIPKENARVIDLGCGPATWTMDMATELTSVNFVGIDISPIYPAAIHPRNCSFFREDILQGISQPNESFDVAYQRNVAPGFTVEHWQRSIVEAYRLLKPGGYFESVESDVTVQEAGPFTTMCFDHIRLSMASRNVDPSVVRSLDRIMVAAGFVDVQVKEYCVPLGEWGGKMGQLWKQNMCAILETIKPHLAKAGRISEAQVMEMVQSMRKETLEYRSFQTIYVTYGRKPL